MTAEKRSRQFADLLCAHKDSIFSILVHCETLKMAEDELRRCMDLLTQLDAQRDDLANEHDCVLSSFLPLNQPLYSFVLQVFIPSLIVKQVYYRPPASLKGIHAALLEVVYPACCNIELCAVTRKYFLDNYVKESNIVNFTGKYENVIGLIEELPDDIAVIYNGSAINPIVVGFDADIDLAVQGLIEARLYNSGQDCMAPACIFLDERISPSFLAALKKELSMVIVGPNTDPDSLIGPMIEEQSIEDFKKVKNKYAANICWGGDVDENHRYIYPTIFYFDSVTLENQSVYYAPYFWIMCYRSLDEVQNYLDSAYAERYAGYISLYGTSVQQRIWCSGKNALIPLEDTTLFFEENGNQEFGGYGLGCGFVYENGIFDPHPLLLLREINRILEK